MTRKLVTNQKDLEDLIDCKDLKSAMINLNEFRDEIKAEGADPLTATVEFPYQEKPYIEYKRLETEEEYERRLRNEQAAEAREREQLVRLKAKYET